MPDANGVETTLERLLLVQQRIRDVLSSPNKQVSVNGRLFTKHELSELREQELELLAEYQRELAGGGIVAQQGVPL